MLKKVFLATIGFLIAIYVYKNNANYSLKELLNLDLFNYGISLNFLIISFFSYLLGVLARGIRLLYLNNNSVSSVRKIIYLQILSTCSQLILPFRLGDGVRIYLFRNYFDGISESAFLFIIEKILDTITLITILIFAIWNNQLSLPLISDSRFFILFSILICSLFIIPDLIDLIHCHLIIHNDNTKFKLFLLKISKNILLGRDKTIKKIKGKEINILFLSYLIWVFDCLSFTFIINSLNVNQFIAFIIGPFVALSSFLPSPPLGIYGSVNIGFYWAEITSGIAGIREYSEIYSLLIYGSLSILTFIVYLTLKLNNKIKNKF